MLRKSLITLTIVVAITLLGVAPASPVSAQNAPPVYQLQYLGPGSPVAISNTGIVVGRSISGNNYQPLVSVNGSPWTALPVPNGAMSVFPTDVNDSGVIVGVSFSPQWNPIAVRWTPTGGGYTVEELPRLPGDASSYALGINNLGQIVGARRAFGYAPTGQGWLYSDQQGVVDLAARYNWWTYPTELNDVGQVIGGAERLDLNTGARRVDRQWTGELQCRRRRRHQQQRHDGWLSLVAIDIAEHCLGLSLRRCCGLGVHRRNEQVHVRNSNINNRGDIGYGEYGAGLYLDGLGKFALGNLARSGGDERGLGDQRQRRAH